MRFATKVGVGDDDVATGDDGFTLETLIIVLALGIGGIFPGQNHADKTQATQCVTAVEAI
jgi:hypothetical protein